MNSPFFFLLSLHASLLYSVLPLSSVNLKSYLENPCSPTVLSYQFNSVQSLSRVCLFATPWTTACQVSLSITNSQSLLKLISIESVMPSNHYILCGPLLLPSSTFPRIRVFSNVSVLHIRCPKYWSFSFSISPSNEYSVLISFRIDWFDLLAVQGTLKGLLQHHFSWLRNSQILACHWTLRDNGIKNSFLILIGWQSDWVPPQGERDFPVSMC